VIMDWDQVVKKITVSSNTGQSSALFDDSTSTYWQSSGQQNKVEWSRVDSLKTTTCIG